MGNNLVDKKVLILTNEFPPQPGGRSEKIARRVKYLYRNGWEAIILVPSGVTQVDKDPLLDEIPYNVKVYRTNYLFRYKFPSLIRERSLYKGILDKISGLFSVPKGYIRWLPYAVFKGIQAIKKHNIDVIYTMNNPVTLHLIGYLLKRFTEKPWLAEFRDPWVGYIYNRRPKIIDRLLEELVVRSADKILWYGTIQIEDDYFYKHYPKEPIEKFVMIPFMGYDKDDFKNVNRNIYRQKKTPFKICYTGVFYEGGRSPVHFFEALSNFVKNNGIIDKDVKVIFAGDWNDEYDRIVKKLGLETIVEYKGYLSRNECLKLYSKSHVLLIIGAEKGLEKNFPSKFWDYLGSQRVILGLLPTQSALAKTIEQQNLGIIANPTDSKSIEKTLEKLFSKFRDRMLNINPSVEFLRSVTREDSERKFAEVLDTLTHF